MAYEGVLGKLGKNIFEGLGKGNAGALAYTGIGAGVGGVAGGLTGDDTLSGVMSGALFGAGVGASVNLLPKFVNNTLVKHDFRGFSNSINDIASEGIDSYRPLINSVNNPLNKTLVSDFKDISKKHFFKSNREFSRDTISGILNRVSGNTSDLSRINKMANDSWTGTESFLGKKTGKDAFNISMHNASVWSGLNSKEKWQVGTAKTLQLGFDSVYNHVVKPTGDFFKKGVEKTFDNGSAAVVSAIGLYEGYNAVNNVADGNYSGAFANLVGFGALKVAYSQGMNVKHFNQMLKEKGVTFKQVANTAGVGVGLARFKNGTSKLNDSDMDVLGKASKKAFETLRQSGLTDSTNFVVGPHMKAAGKTIQGHALKTANKTSSNTMAMLDRIEKKGYKGDPTVMMSDTTHGSFLDMANTRYIDNVLGSSVLFGTTGMLAGGVMDDSSMLEGFAYGSITGAAKGAAMKLSMNMYAKGAVKNSTAEVVDGKYKLKINEKLASQYNTKNFFGG